MTIVSCISDVHLEFDDCALPGGDILLLAGDLLLAGELRPARIDKEAARNRERYRRFVAEEFRKYWRVLFVLGNHDHWGTYFGEAPNLIRELFKRHAPNAQVLDNEFVEIEGVRFIGSTLWATYGHGTANHYALQKGMRDFARIKKHGAPFLVHDLNEAHQKAIFFLKHDALRTEMPCVVMTHYAPTYFAIDRQRFPDGRWDDAYASNQHGLILKSRLWLSGHSHNRFRLQIGETKVAANPRGYAGHEPMATEFDPTEADFDLNSLNFLV